MVSLQRRLANSTTRSKRHLISFSQVIRRWSATLQLISKTFLQWSVAIFSSRAATRASISSISSVWKRPAVTLKGRGKEEGTTHANPAGDRAEILFQHTRISCWVGSKGNKYGVDNLALLGAKLLRIHVYLGRFFQLWKYGSNEALDHSTSAW